MAEAVREANYEVPTHELIMAQVEMEDSHLLERIKRLPPNLQTSFLRELENLYLGDMEDMMDFFGESRLHIKEAADDIKRLRKDGNANGSQKSKKEQKALDKYLKKRAKRDSSHRRVAPMDTEFSCFQLDTTPKENADDGEAAKKFVKKKQRAEKQEARRSGQNVQDARKNSKDIKKDSEKMMAGAKSADKRMLDHRSKQRDAINKEREKRKDKKKETMNDVADEVLETQKNVEKSLNANKQKQSDDIRKKIRDRKSNEKRD